MPYIITTARPTNLRIVTGAATEDTRVRRLTARAVTTHDQARAEAWKQTYLVCVDMGYDQSWLTTARGLGENGGSVGPLPDGTVIEVCVIPDLRAGQRSI